MATAADGTIYGVATVISSSVTANLFAISPSGAFTTVASIGNQIGGNPDAGPGRAGDGSLWGPLLTGSISMYSAIYHEVAGAIVNPPVLLFSGETSISESTFLPSGDFVATEGGGTCENGYIFHVKP